MGLDYNNQETADRRSTAQLLNLQQEEQAILIEDRFTFLDTPEEEDVLTAVIVNYQA